MCYWDMYFRRVGQLRHLLSEHWLYRVNVLLAKLHVLFLVFDGKSTHGELNKYRYLKKEHWRRVL